MDRRKISIFGNFLIIIILCFMSFYFDVILESLSIYKHRLLKRRHFNNPSTKTILFWNSMFGDGTFYFNIDNFQSCPGHKECVATNDRNMINEENFDAILFHGIHDLDNNDLPKKRSISQRYVFVSLESPANRNVLRYFPEDYFNLTMTYTLNSDVPWPYSNIEETKSGSAVAPRLTIRWNTSYEDSDENVDEDIVKLVKRKTKMSAWFRSNCDTKSGRENYVQDLEKYMSVDKFGKCTFSDKICSRNRNCFAEVVQPNYFFYLSFENSFCQDYVTEKFFNALQYYVIPVVYGAANYSHFAPPHSYINALDFNSPKSLAGYLIELSRNQTEYLKYFRWKKYYSVGSSHQKTICDLCQMLHERNGTKIYKKISTWYSLNQCPLHRKLGDQIESGGPLYATKGTLKFP